MRCEKKFESGLVSAHLNVVDAKIKNIRFYGDFFGAEDITELEKALVGCTLDHELKNILKGIRVGDYISGLTAEDLYELIMG